MLKLVLSSPSPRPRVSRVSYEEARRRVAEVRANPPEPFAHLARLHD